MPNPALLIAFFIFVMAGVVAAGYYLLLRPASSTAGNADQSAAQVLTEEDRDVAEEVVKILREDGIEVLLEAQAESVTHTAGNVRLAVTHDGASRVVEGSHLLVATGRRPNTERLQLEVVGVKTDERGFIEVDERLQTSVPGIYAVGDANGGMTIYDCTS